jgi:hypothetical protein
MNDISLEGVTTPTSAPLHHRWLEFVLLLGLAGLFLSNAVVALVEPSDFTSLVDNSAFRWTIDLGGALWIAPVIFAHDVVIGLALIASVWAGRGVRLAVLAWAGLWLLLVAVVKVTAL